MRLVIALHIEKLTDGVHLAACDELEGLVAHPQGRTNQETINIARDVAAKLIDSQQGTRAPFGAEGDAALGRRVHAELEVA